MTSSLAKNTAAPGNLHVRQVDGLYLRRQAATRAKHAVVSLLWHLASKQVLQHASHPYGPSPLPESDQVWDAIRLALRR